MKAVIAEMGLFFFWRCKYVANILLDIICINKCVADRFWTD